MQTPRPLLHGPVAVQGPRWGLLRPRADSGAPELGPDKSPEAGPRDAASPREGPLTESKLTTLAARYMEAVGRRNPDPRSHEGFVSWPFECVTFDQLLVRIAQCLACCNCPRCRLFLFLRKLPAAADFTGLVPSLLDRRSAESR